MTTIEKVTFDLEAELDALIKREGPYVDHPNDKGGPTKYGITQAVALANGWNGRMQDLSIAFAKDVYRRIYWSTPGYDKIAAMGLPLLAAELFDTGVNMGPTTQGKWLQRWLNALCGQYPKYVHIDVDGSAGAGTRSAISYLIGKRGLAAAQDALVDAVNCSQGARYLELVEVREANEAFIWGWLTSRITLAKVA
jgi:lysozyme family protein